MADAASNANRQGVVGSNAQQLNATTNNSNNPQNVVAGKDLDTGLSHTISTNQNNYTSSGQFKPAVGAFGPEQTSATTGTISQQLAQDKSKANAQAQVNNVNSPIKFNGSPNPLSQIDQPAYYIKFFLIGDDDVIDLTNSPNYGKFDNGEAFTNITQAVIAETGATGFNITNFEIESVGSFNDSTRNSTFNYIYKMTIVEPMGCSLIDRMYAAASVLGIANYNKAPFFIELRFQGYNPKTGNYIPNIGPLFNLDTTNTNSRTWTYSVMITKIDVSLNNGSSTYELELRSYSNIAQANNNRTIQQSMVLKGKTIGQSFDDLAKAFLDQDAQSYEKPRHTYSFDILPIDTAMISISGIDIDPRNWSVSSEQTIQPIRSGTTEPSTKGTRENQLAKGTDINGFVDYVFSNSIEGQRLVRRTSVSEKFGTEDKYIVLWNIIPKTTIRKDDPFNDRNNSYNYNFTWTIVPYLVSRTIFSPEQAQEVEDKNKQKVRIEDLVSKNLIKKRYDYIFTGLNTEIVNLDLKFHFNWAVALPLNDGVYNYAILNQGNSQFNEAAYLRYAKAKSTRVITELESDTQRLQDLQKKITDKNYQGTPQTIYDENGNLRSVKLDSADLKQYNTLNDAVIKAKQDNDKPNNPNKTQTQNSLQQATYARDKYQAERDPAYLAGTIAAQQDAAAAQKNNRDQLSAQAILVQSQIRSQYLNKNSTNYIEDLKTPGVTLPVIPITFSQVPGLENVVNKAIEQRHDINRSLFAAAINGVTEGNANHLINLELEIRGDPYWLGYTDTQIQKQIDERKQETLDKPKFHFSDQAFMLFFNIPQGFEEPLPYPVLEKNQAFTGLYTITKITHTFAGGEFKQKLTAVRDLSVKIEGNVE